MTEDTKTKVNHHVVFLDKSGSMDVVAQDTVVGFNEHVQMVKDLGRDFQDQEFRVTLVTFNHKIDTLYFNEAAELLDEITADQYSPDGRTALYDAVGLTLTTLKKEMKESEDDEEVKVVVTIFTDGVDNSSTEFDAAHIHEMTKQLENTGDWAFTYIGSHRDVGDVAKTLGIQSKNAKVYAGDTLGTRASIRCMGSMLKGYASARSMGLDSAAVNEAGDEAMAKWDADYQMEKGKLEAEQKTEQKTDAKSEGDTTA